MPVKIGGKMRKFLSFLVAAVFVACAASSVFALGVENSTLTAKVVFEGEGEFAWDLAIRNMSNDTSTTSITWSGATPSVTEWKTADQYVLINSTMTGLNGKIRVYTRNKEGSEFKTVTASSENLGGLVGTTKIIPMGWRMVDLLKADLNLAAEKAIPVVPDRKEGGAEAGAYASSYFLDKANWNFDRVYVDPNPDNSVDNIAYSSILTSGGMKYGSGPNDRGGSPTGTFAMFISANFATAIYDTYGCDTITFQGINE